MQRIYPYIYQLSDWPNFRWRQEKFSSTLAELHLKQGRLIGRMETIGFPQRDEAVLQTLTEEVVKSSEIEGEILNPAQVRSSIARHLGMDIGALLASDRQVDGVVEMTLEATQNFAQPLAKERLFRWHNLLFPNKPSNIKVASWRDDAKGPMQVVSGPIGRERVHYEAPPAESLKHEMTIFLEKINKTEIDKVLKSALAHLWFVTIHPFDDGNGRIARAIADWALASSENSAQRYYSMSAQIRRERKDYYEILEETQKGRTLDITHWMQWFLRCLDRAILRTEETLATVFKKDKFWKSYSHLAFNERHQKILNKLLDGNFEGKLTSSKWAKLTKCSQDTAHRDILELIEHNILVKDSAGGRSTSYSLK